MKLADLHEGFMGFTVNDSDAAADLFYATEEIVKAAKAKLKKETGRLLPDNVVNMKMAEVAIEKLRKHIDDDNGGYNTHGALNIAMIMHEHFKEFRSVKAWKRFAGEVAEKLESQVDKRYSTKAEYGQQVQKFAKKLRALEN